MKIAFSVQLQVIVTIRATVEAALDAGMNDSQRAWWTRALPRAAQGSSADLLQAYTEASRQLGDTPLASITTRDGSELKNWTLEDAGRLILLLARHDASGDERFAADAAECYEQGDSREQRSWLRAVAHLPNPERYRALVIDACRTNILPMFEAVACDNDYPARFFPERNFNQMVLKALFNNVALARVRGLDRRANSELARMAGDYGAERRAAGRSIPGDIGLAMTGAAAETQQ
jgi:hypothetical protein